MFCFVLVLALCVLAAVAFDTWTPGKGVPTITPNQWFAPKSVKSPIKAVVASKPGSKVTAPAKKAAAPAKKGIDFTWGGRPDPTPEIVIDETPSFLTAPWRYGRK